MKLTPLIKGVITGAVMIVATLLLYKYKVAIKSSSLASYSLYLIYAAGILWTLFDYSRSAAFVKSFGTIFGQGFRCFVIVTLIMVTFTGIFVKIHPEFAEQDSEVYRQYLVELKDNTPSEIDKMVASQKKYYLIKNISAATFGFFIQGALYTAVGAGLVLLMRRK